MVSVVLVPLEVADVLPAVVQEVDQALTQDELAALAPVSFSGGVVSAELAALILLADVAHCYERSRAGHQQSARRWRSLLAEMVGLVALLDEARHPEWRLQQD